MQDRLYFRYVFQKKLKSERTLTSLKFYNIEDIEHPNFMDEINELTRKGYVLITRNFSTGLKDKNGKLIYEGDILKIEINKLDGESYNKHSFEEAFYGYVHWYSSSYEICLDLDNEKTKSFPLYFDKYEVIDNIYENPELLKEVQGE